MLAALSLAAAVAVTGGPEACYDVAAVARIERAKIVGDIPAPEGEITLGTIDDLTFVIEKVLAGRVAKRIVVRSPLTDLFTPQTRLLIFLRRKPTGGHNLIDLRVAHDDTPFGSMSDPPACG